MFNTIGPDQFQQRHVLKDECDLLDDLDNYFWDKWAYSGTTTTQSTTVTTHDTTTTKATTTKTTTPGPTGK
jgi:hypothetical protein